MSGKNSSSNRTKNEKNAHLIRTGTNYRRLARAGICVVSLGVLVAAGVIFFSHRPENKVLAVPPPCDDPFPVTEPGPARPWELNLQVSTYSSVNTRTRNLFTAIPIVSWSGKGPAMNMMLYHNAANVNSAFDLTRNVGFDLGPGWTISYSDQIVLDETVSPPLAFHIHDDGTVDKWGL